MFYNIEATFIINEYPIHVNSSITISGSSFYVLG